MIKLKDLIVEKKSDKKTFDKIVKALKGIPVRATIHLDDEDRISIALGYDYFRNLFKKRNDKLIIQPKFP